MFRQSVTAELEEIESLKREKKLFNMETEACILLGHLKNL